MRRVSRATAGTGTEATAAPATPCTWNRTCHDPLRISHRLPVKKFLSAADRFIASGVGGWSAPSPVSGIGVIETPVASAPVTRTSIAATPGITAGGRTVTNIRYGPAAVSSNTSGEPTCAHAGTPPTAASRPHRMSASP